MNRTFKHTFLCLMAAAALFLASCGKNVPLTPPIDQNILRFGTEESFDVVTWNLQTFPLSQASMETIAHIITQMEADVIALQEIMDYNSFHELVGMIPHYEGFVYNATNSYRLAYLYDTRTVEVQNVYTIYTGQTHPFPRAPYVMECSFKGEPVILINNHLKAFGDNYIDEDDPWDEEYRRRLACQLLDQYIVENFPNDRVIVLGDLNDQIAEPREYNVFLAFLDKPDEYKFTDMDIALRPTYNNVSYPTYLSHIDHILITNELFDAFDAPDAICRVIRVDEYMGTWQNYATMVSDHRPLGVRLYLDYGRK